MTAAEKLLANDPASKLLGISIKKIDEASCSLTMQVTSQLTNGYDVCHGGFVFTLADTACAFAGAIDDEVVLTSSNHIDFLAPAKLGDQLTAQAEITIAKGRQVFCDVIVSNQAFETIAMMRAKLVSKIRGQS